MDIFDRLGNLIRTIIDDEDGESNDAFRDPDEKRAWEELEAYMRDDATARTDAGGHSPFESGERGGMAASLRRDFRNLEVAPGAPLEEVRRSYKRLIASFHPDRHSADPEKMRTATELTKKLNQSFQRIRAYYEGGA